jgi:prepilin-type N-terminal cleavage/methylation domain-containing protein/prepilin-type processing-associated H-X9-DG protein
MIQRWQRGFTLVELLVVIGIIALLISILLPSLNRARSAAIQVRCESNLRVIGQGISGYVSEYLGYLPASYVYNNQIITGNTETPAAPQTGYVHWSALIMQNYLKTTPTAPAGDGMVKTAPGPFGSTKGWEVFECPALDKGGLPPTDTTDDNHDFGLPNDAPNGYIDYQAPRLAYTLNEALCPRNKFVMNFQQCVRTEHYVSAGRVKDPSETILGTEWSEFATVVEDNGEASGQTVVKSHRPINGFTGLQNAGGTYVDLVSIEPSSGIIRVSASMLTRDPEPGFTPANRLDWIGHNHGVKRTDSLGWDLRTTNFLYLDGHVENKQVRQTITPWQWGRTIYTLSPNDDVYNK